MAFLMARRYNNHDYVLKFSEEGFEIICGNGVDILI